MVKKIFAFLTVWGLLLPSSQAEIRHDPALATLFRNAGVEGQFVLIDAEQDQTVLSDPAGAQRRFVPASTFKVLNALIAIELGVVQEDTEVFPWDGKPRFIKTWERDLTLKEAMAVSAVPVYQELARRIGLDRMGEQVGKAGYGNGMIGTVVDRFWLDGPLAISATEQAQFLARLRQGTLPFAQQSQERVRRLIPMEAIDGARLYGKTGWAMAAQPMVGWYVGWVENGDRVATFALNMVMKDQNQAPLRKSLAIDMLRQLGLLDPLAQNTTGATGR
ncbi:MAG: class D beta-lactamase [Magnetococcales bacterium]|nr:class D beta-lactamase [Magnetococcales bacterium]